MPNASQHCFSRLKEPSSLGLLFYETFFIPEVSLEVFLFTCSNLGSSHHLESCVLLVTHIKAETLTVLGRMA